jgi:hypothetical protein
VSFKRQLKETTEVFHIRLSVPLMEKVKRFADYYESDIPYTVAQLLEDGIARNVDFAKHAGGIYNKSVINPPRVRKAAAGMNNKPSLTSAAPTE